MDNRQEFAMLAFQKNGDEYAGVTFNNRTFGTRNSDLLSLYVDGKQISRSEAEHIVQYVGRGIVILEKEERVRLPKITAIYRPNKPSQLRLERVTATWMSFSVSCCSHPVES